MEMSNSSQIDTNYDYSRSTTVNTNPVTTFNNADSAWRTEVKTVRDDTYDVGYREDADLGAFLSRPLKIYSDTWDVGSNFSAEFNPWSAFIGNANVLARMQNYFLFRGDLEVDIMINGNGFYYGRLLANYHPLKDYRPFDESTGTNDLYAMQATQRPHVFLDPSTSTGGTLSCPYFWPKNWCNLAAAEYNQLGTVSITSLGPLRQANSGDGQISINVFARLKNVRLTMPTVNIIGSISPQSGERDIVADVEEGSSAKDPPARFLSTKERDDWLRKQAVEQAYQLRLQAEEEEQPKSRICGDPVAIAAAVLAGLSAAGFAREINSLRSRAKALEGLIRQVDEKTNDVESSMHDNDLEADLEAMSDIVMQAGSKSTGKSKGGDEYGTGIVSKPASILAKAAGAITNVPVIGKYALASKFALEGVANVARIFGYSRPPVVDTIKPFRMHPAGLMAPTDADECVARLVLDSKQELSIDPTTVGLESTDQMAFAHVLQKESYLTSFDWDESAVSEANLFYCNVTPGYFNTLGVWPGANARAVQTPVTQVAQMFKYWRGSLTFRFQIVASQFHKGRLRLSWDPYAMIGDATNYNVAYTRIIDLAEERDFEVTFRWGQAEAWRECPRIAEITRDQVYSTVDTGLTPLAERSNGQYTFSVLNQLTTPNPTISAPVRINVFVRAGDDFEFGGPDPRGFEALTYNEPVVGQQATARALASSSYKERKEAAEREMSDIVPQSGEMSNEETDNGMSEDCDNAPVVVSEINAIGGDPIAPTDNSLYIYMGEKVCSLRSLMKRYSFHEVLQGQADSISTLTIHNNLNFPYQPGYSSQGRHGTAGLLDYNYCHQTFLGYITPMYGGWRGGIRRKYTPATTNSGSMMNVTRNSDSITGDEQASTTVAISNDTDSSLNYQFAELTLNSGGGTYMTDLNANPTVEVELPFYSEYRFAHGQSEFDATTLTRKPDGYNHTLEVVTRNFTTSSVQTGSTIRSSVAAGEDFTNFWFLACPTIYTYDNPLPD